jgi:hypothetical protein
MDVVVLVTRMPSTGEITNVKYVGGPIKEVEARWADTPSVSVYSRDEWLSRPICRSCGRVAELRLCADCR